MNCDDVKNGLYVYLDGEFAAPEEADFRGHLEACPHCRQLVVREAGFLGHVRDCLAAPATPADLRGRIEAALDAAPAPRRAPRRVALPRSGWLVAGPIAAAALAVLVVAGARFSPAESAAEQEATRQVVNAHRNPLPMEIRGSEDQVKAWLQETVPYAVRLPFEEAPGMTLVGARLTQVGGEPAVIYRYDAHGRPLSVLQAARTAELADAEPRVDHVAGYGVVTYNQQDVVHSVVGDLPEGELMRLVPASYRPR